MKTRESAAGDNRLLDSLEPEDLARLSPHLRSVEIARGQVLCEAGDPQTRIHFPIGAAVISLMAVMQNGSVAETAAIGRDGAAGLLTGICGQRAFNRQVVRVAGAVQSAGLIRYRRGAMEIVDRLQLEAASCDCYAMIRNRYDELLPFRTGSAASKRVAG